MFVPLTPIRCLHRAIDVFPDKTGVVCGAHRFTYAQFGERCERLASALTRIGVLPGDRVAWLSFNNHQLLESYFGVPQARAIAMPLNVRLSASELTAILKHAGASVLIFENDFVSTVEQVRAHCPQIHRYIAIDEAAAPAHLTYEELLDLGTPERADIFRIDENSIAELFYTSGSTGSPKGVALSHRTLYLHGMCVALLHRDVNIAVELHTIPLFHANGWGKVHACTMLGVPQVMVHRFEPSAVLRMIAEHRATGMCLVPTMAQALLNAPGLAEADLSSMRTIMIGGAASSPELIQRMEKAFACNCYAGYGLSETSPVVTVAMERDEAYPSDDERWRRQSMTGWSVPGVTLRVVDLQMNDVPRDGKTMGEIVAMGDHVMDGYYREPQATSAVMSGPWLHTGDMAVWDEHGYIQIVDRSKEIIISGGENISSIEIEKAIYAHEGVLECAVVAAPDEKWGEVPVAVVLRKPGASLTAEDLLEFLSTRLGRFKMPRAVEFRDEQLPKTGTGKIRKIDIREKFWQGQTRRVHG
ncbi:MAG TPA: long-chain-fatty-acid--CoA ligase [Bryobacteraceae bacterium]|nr:long-chain-fatty-acid--CoA ligase [Bryobacteraceae bacterium]